MTASADVRRSARDYLWLVALAPMLGVFAFAYDGIYIGATWARDMRNLMMLSLLIFLAAWLALRSFGNAGLWGALLVHYAARGGLQALRYPAMLRASFPLKSRIGPMQLQFVGCGDALGSGGRFNTCFHVTGESVNFLIDCGASSLPALKRLAIARDGYRSHPDHAFPRRSFWRAAVPAAGCAVHAPDPAAGDRRTARNRDAADAGDGSAVRTFIEDKASASICRWSRSSLKKRARFGAVKVTPYPVVHGESGGPFLAYRIEAEGRVIAYSADTEWTETLIPAGARRRPVHRRSLLLRQDRQEPSQPENAGNLPARDQPEAAGAHPYERRHAGAAGHARPHGRERRDDRGVLEDSASSLAPFFTGRGSG